MKNYYKLDETYYPYAVELDTHDSVCCPRHMHIAPEIVVVKGGVLDMIIDGKYYKIPTGACAFVPPLTPHEFLKGEKNVCYVLTFAKEILLDVFDKGQIFRIKEHVFCPNKILFDLVEFYLSEEGRVKSAALARAALIPLLYEIFKSAELLCELERENDVLLSAIEYMSVSYAEQIDLSSVAEQVGIHPVSLSRMFCARTGIGFMKFLKYLRASAATNLMQKSDMTFAEIAYAVGFGSIRSFNRTFMEIYSITPTEYRESLKKFNP